MPRLILTLAIVGLAVYALADLAGARREETGGLPKWLWAVLIVFVPVIGGVAWIVFRRTGGPATTPDRGRSSSGPRRDGPLAPDDDPEFLWRLKLEAERERRRREGEDETKRDG